ncbi:Lanthionine synthetase C-like protein OS=Streptomyces microflavus OX=1919 GN=Smic_64460 PE=4 SV=1 [Streptomyces microflavus]
MDGNRALGQPGLVILGGHANTGMAHGIAGVLALLALAARKSTVTDGHLRALRAILAWLDRWQEETGRGPAWPYWVTRGELRTGRRAASKLRRPSWCYGTAGLARAQQLAALAIGDTERQITAENALAAALCDPDQLGATTDNGLCHGFAGLTHIAVRTAADAHPSTVGRLRAAIPGLLTAICSVDNDLEREATAGVTGTGAGPGLLDGAAGTALALLAADQPPRALCSPRTPTPPRRQPSTRGLSPTSPVGEEDPRGRQAVGVRGHRPRPRQR